MSSSNGSFGSLQVVTSWSLPKDSACGLLAEVVGCGTPGKSSGTGRGGLFASGQNPLTAVKSAFYMVAFSVEGRDSRCDLVHAGYLLAATNHRGCPL